MQVILLNVEDLEHGDRWANVYVYDYGYEPGDAPITTGGPDNWCAGSGAEIEVYAWKEVKKDGSEVDLKLTPGEKESLELALLEAIEEEGW